MLDQTLEKQKEAMVSLSALAPTGTWSVQAPVQSPSVHTWGSRSVHVLVQGQFRGCGEALCFGCLSCGCREALAELRGEAVLTSFQFSNENQEKKGPWLSQRSREHSNAFLYYCVFPQFLQEISLSPVHIPVLEDLTLFFRLQVMVIMVLWVLRQFPFENLQLPVLAGIESRCSFEVPAAGARPGVHMMNHETFVFQPSHSGHCKVPFPLVIFGDEIQLEQSQVIAAFSCFTPCLCRCCLNMPLPLARKTLGTAALALFLFV